MNNVQHLYRDRGQGETVCGNTYSPTICNALSPTEFRQQLGSATGRDLHWEVEPQAICALCATRYIEEQRK